MEGSLGGRITGWKDHWVEGSLGGRITGWKDHWVEGSLGGRIILIIQSPVSKTDRYKMSTTISHFLHLTPIIALSSHLRYIND